VYDILFLISSPKSGDYSRLTSIRDALPEVKLDAVYLDRPLTAQVGALVILKQFNVAYDLRKYNLIFHWPASFQRDEDGLGYGFYNPAQHSIFRSWKVLEQGILSLIPRERALNPYVPCFMAANKLYALTRLQAFGIAVPSLMFTNDADAYNGFVAQQQCVIKTVCDTVQVDDNNFFYAAEAPMSIDTDDIEELPIVVQKYVNTSTEYRIYNFREEVFPIYLERSCDSGHVDIRLQYESTAHVGRLAESGIFEPLAKKIRDALSIDFFACDVLEQDGSFYVVDVNPCGTWHWLAPSLVSFLDKAFARYIKRRLASVARDDLWMTNSPNEQ